ncbi:MAG: hypothetical protein A2Y57_04815 [Candidatus Woykebacteria bacterium RBG_13_40_7b]|uniref:Secondary thiamine-phosphate synthase enzyme n=1 Tax=Candidatus Woykebacteria bacterium RBG_13_40_7b TaxID=1802594 RepID=A0A1G1WBZ9_9BACT|nr:MAG: hypothetical protein A2Y57_04815 [Candidatus Woykebacteria bacterium RBG_13_40_7b]
MIKKFDFSTNKKEEIVDITNEVEEVVESSDVKEGICLVLALHTTAAILIGEGEEGLEDDMIKHLDHLKASPPFKHAHNPDHAPSHVLSSFLGQEKVVPIENGRLSLGTWQRILFFELDGPRSGREVLVLTK